MSSRVFVPNEETVVSPYKAGVLSSLTFAVKELYAVEGFVTGCGNPCWKENHEPAKATAPAVKKLLNEGASMAGKVISDEMAFSLDGENVHYGTPLNPRSPDSIPGGSSSGSASAVASGIVDFSLGTDTAGSIRIPASYCGIYGFRSSHGSISLEGVHSLAPSFDVVGWFAKSPKILATVGRVLFDAEIAHSSTPKLIIIKDLFDALDSNIRRCYDEFFEMLAAHHYSISEVVFGKPDFSAWVEVIRNIQ